jgi:hypothetical protein
MGNVVQELVHIRRVVCRETASCTDTVNNNCGGMHKKLVLSCCEMVGGLTETKALGPQPGELIPAREIKYLSGTSYHSANLPQTFQGTQ